MFIYALFLRIQKIQIYYLDIYILCVIFVDIGFQIPFLIPYKILAQNLFMFGHILFVSNILQNARDDSSYLRNIRWTLFLLIIFLSISYIHNYSLISHKYMIYELLIACIIISVVEIYYFTCLLNSRKIENATQHLSFWIIIGNLFWNLFFIIRFGLLYSLFREDSVFFDLSSLLFSIVNILTYSTYFYGLLCAYKYRN